MGDFVSILSAKARFYPSPSEALHLLFHPSGGMWRGCGLAGCVGPSHCETPEHHSLSLCGGYRKDALLARQQTASANELGDRFKAPIMELGRRGLMCASPARFHVILGVSAPVFYFSAPHFCRDVYFVSVWVDADHRLYRCFSARLF